MRQGFEGKICAFCHPDPAINQIVWEDKHFMVWHVHPMFMRPELHLHVMIVPREHVRFVGGLPDEAGTSLIKAARFMKKHFNYTGGLFHGREGDMRENAGTVPHLHFNIFQANHMIEVRVPVYKDPGDREANRERATRFAEYYEQGVSPERFDELVRAGTMSPDGYQASQI